jgi:hypothetical protein
MLMTRLLSRQLIGLAVLTSVCLLPGCGESLPPLYPVSGKITLDSKPFTQGEVSFHPDGIKLPNGILIGGKIDANGQYTIRTAGKEGAPAGDYKVTILYLPKDPPATGKKTLPSVPFNSKFADPKKTPLKIKVSETPSPGAYDLKLAK